MLRVHTTATFGPRVWGDDWQYIVKYVWIRLDTSDVGYRVFGCVGSCPPTTLIYKINSCNWTDAFVPLQMTLNTKYIIKSPRTVCTLSRNYDTLTRNHIANYFYPNMYMYICPSIQWLVRLSPNTMDMLYYRITSTVRGCGVQCACYR